MKKQALILFVVFLGSIFLCCPAWGAGFDGALAGYQGGALSDMAVAGPAGIIGHDLSLIFGSLEPARNAYQDPGYGYSFITGPNLSATNLHDYAEGASFGPGGEFNAYNDTAAWCAQVCHFSGNWVWAQLTQTVLSDGTYVYTLTGELTGSYKTDADARACRAFVTIPLFDESTLIFEGMTSISYGGLQIIYQPN